jgi:hypothetical protein
VTWLLKSLVNREVVVESHGVRVRGRLVGFSESQSRPDHRPFVVVLQTAQGMCLMRDWNTISFDGRF